MIHALDSFNEDAALHLRLQGITVTDIDAVNNLPGGVRKVPVKFRLPEDEVTSLNYPCIIIELMSIERATEREHRAYGGTTGNYHLPYAPEGENAWWAPGATTFDPSESPYSADFPIPYWLNYQVSTFSRLARDHTIPITAALMTDNYLGRNAWLDVPQDGTFRRLDIVGGPERSYARIDVEGKQKRLLRDTFLIRISSELIGPIINTTPGQYPLVTSVDLDLTCYRSFADLSYQEVSESMGVVASRGFGGWNTQALAQ